MTNKASWYEYDAVKPISKFNKSIKHYQNAICFSPLSLGQVNKTTPIMFQYWDIKKL